MGNPGESHPSLTRTNIEFKAYCGSLERARAACAELGTTPARTVMQRDVYFPVRSGRLKLRSTDDSEHALIHYDRLDQPLPKPSDFEVLPLGHEGLAVVGLLRKALGSTVEIVKRREVHQWRGALVNLDTVEGLGTFVEVEVDVATASGPDKAHQLADVLAQKLGLTPADLVPWSYAELKVMHEASSRWRPTLPSGRHIFLLDGASCTGKTSLATRLADRKNLDLDLVPRYSTRRPRGDRSAEPEYLFVSPHEFRRLAGEGAFIEYRDFQFGMSYGLPWEQTFAPIKLGRRVIGIIDLGNVRHVKDVLPEAVTILITAPEHVLRQRLIARGYNRELEINERLENARRVAAYRPFYDHIVENGERELEAAENHLAEIIASYDES
ncbi:MAG TPA: CYTH domain-containing protein [Methylomirabilota bacterium]|nr:CYTH domain-containing protein [Methylomirabilota bacterium]